MEFFLTIRPRLRHFGLGHSSLIRISNFVIRRFPEVATPAKINPAPHPPPTAAHSSQNSAPKPACAPKCSTYSSPAAHWSGQSNYKSPDPSPIDTFQSSPPPSPASAPCKPATAAWKDSPCH